ncbi:hypothetical protein AZF37_05680 [endosymbiont 'TC1' of Trimyema compressum]|uniref:regulatory protein RecX n=1 Tax=endosymbiont 'TC1' of Trimyema compressum TaxID=243899 RepID=UPI0007F0D579|nr:RecX family transcriptional regulator [endosymbiont 'TC1' of Trimyema compressum]AMP20733.1 hypothetical protein AZF37_05680 [endosymbiont 'TC1' of Trimyema compressum]
MKAREYGLYLLNKRAYTRKELENKLFKKGFQCEEVTEVLNEFMELKWINDYVYAETYILNQIEYGFKSKMQIQYKLMEKGIDKDHIMALMEQYYTREKEEKNIKYLIEKYSRTGSLPREKLIARLGRKGFSISFVVSVLDEE